MSDVEPTVADEPVVEPGEPASGPVVEPVDLGEIERELAAVDQALARLDDGTYGRCQVCQSPLDDSALAADPTTSICGDHLDVVAH